VDPSWASVWIPSEILCTILLVGLAIPELSITARVVFVSCGGHGNDLQDVGYGLQHEA
jgi:hypothetical protein